MLIDNGKYKSYASIDATDCTILEPSQFDEIWLSQKTNVPALRYELSVSIDGEIVWMSGPYACGNNSDVLIFRNRHLTKLEDNELLVAYKG